MTLTDELRLKEIRQLITYSSRKNLDMDDAIFLLIQYDAQVAELAERTKDYQDEYMQVCKDSEKIALLQNELATLRGKEQGMELDIEAIKKRCELASPGPWHWGVRKDGKSRGPGLYTATETQVLPDNSHPGEGKKIRPYADAAFISHARQDLPDCVAEIEKLSAHVGKMSDSLMRYHNSQEAADSEIARLRLQCSEQNNTIINLQKIIRQLEDCKRQRDALAETLRAGGSDEKV